MSENNLITVHQMVDLALATPSIGNVNCTVLHSLLHLIITRLELEEYRIEFTGQDIDPSVVANHTITVTEYALPEPGNFTFRTKITKQNEEKFATKIVSIGNNLDNFKTFNLDKDLCPFDGFASVEAAEKIHQLQTSHDDVCAKLDQLHLSFLTTMQEIQEMLDCKLDKNAVPDFKVYILDRLQEMQKKLDCFAKHFSMIPEASCTSYQLLRNLDCLSCQRVVNQKTVETKEYTGDGHNAKPKIQDYLEKHRPKTGESISNPGGKSRFCGGNHTNVKPEERIFRRGNFVQQYGDVGPNVKDFKIQGIDGRMYKGGQSKCICKCRCKDVPEAPPTTPQV